MLTVAAALAAFALAPTASAFNPQIAGLQIALRQHGLYRGPIDAVQGPRTVRAVRVFQRSHRLAVDGLAGPRTRAALGRRGRPLFGSRVIRRGMRGYDVGVLQFLLKRHGVRPRGLDGSFGARTATAVRRFQRRAGLTPDAIVGPHTARRLCAQPACAWRDRTARVTAPRPRAPCTPRSITGRGRTASTRISSGPSLAGSPATTTRSCQPPAPGASCR